MRAGRGTHSPLLPPALAPSAALQFHQHMFCARIDPAVDDSQGGKDLVVSEVGAAGWLAGWVLHG